MGNINNFCNFNLDFIKDNKQLPSSAEFLQFKSKIASLINLDLTNYKNTQMERRINSLMNKNGHENLMEYYQLLKKDPDKLKEFINMLTINVSEFFRNTEKFNELENIYIPQLLKNSSRLKIWSAGCSFGAEIYSLAMILDSHGVLNKSTLIASDFDRNILEKAKKGIYIKQEFDTVKPEYKKYFKKLNSNQNLFQIDPKISQKVIFNRCDLLNSAFEKDFDLILCRNVVIYFTEEAKDKLYQKFYDSLKNKGILFIGSTERINNYKNIGFITLSNFFYQK